ncbi:MAG: nicotinate (nicotinamide) nucleotide adenylyltransferase [Nitrospirae bacterium RBG_13_43_8]|nr:MAG: nicotinate (nicotinamide) nucleotide adenylyltransferase [Nitrospirae bacterium RBG_13_43_8]
MKIGIFGGTFNPIHYGHLRAAEEVREKFDLTKVVFIPAKNPPLKSRELLKSEHRYKMTELALSGNIFFEISDIEFKRPGKSYSVQTLEEMQRIFPDMDLCFILGIDAFLEIPTWYQPERLLSLADFIVISRPSFRFVDLLSSPYVDVSRNELEKLDEAEAESWRSTLKGKSVITALKIPLLNISATEIRRRIREGKSVKYLLPESVESYIISNKLYVCDE